MQRVGCASLLVIAGCTVGAPPGFSGGDHWTFPLVGPLEDGVLITLASVHGRGPYLFAFDPDANVTAIDKELVEEAGLRMGPGPHRIDENNTGQVRFYAEMLDLKVAGLTIDRRDVMVFPGRLYDTEGRHLRGVLGRDLIADSLVFGFDREQGIATLSTTKAFQPPPGAIAIKYQAVTSRAVVTARDVGPVPRRVATARVGPSSFAMHLDLGGALSQLPQNSWARGGLVPAEGRVRLVDEAATVREVTAVATASEVALGAAQAAGVAFVPYAEKRFATEGVDGALGLNFFRGYAVYASWDAATLFLKPRGDAAATTAARLGRWGSALPTCPHPGCATAAAVAGDGAATLTVTRDAEAGATPLELFLGATSEAGPLVPLIVAMPSGTARLELPVPPGYAGATLTVLDASPFPRDCAGTSGCVMPLGGAMTAAPEGGSAAPAGAPAPGAPKGVPLDKLRRLTGEPAIPPSDDIKKTGARLAAAIVRVCLRPDGKVDSTKIVKSSGVPAYDEQLQRTITETWTFEPATVDGQPAGVCTQVPFVPR